jgi:hypothetical protein
MPQLFQVVPSFRSVPERMFVNVRAVPLNVVMLDSENVAAESTPDTHMMSRLFGVGVNAAVLYAEAFVVEATCARSAV